MRDSFHSYNSDRIDGYSPRIFKIIFIRSIACALLVSWWLEVMLYMAGRSTPLFSSQDLWSCVLCRQTVWRQRSKNKCVVHGSMWCCNNEREDKVENNYHTRQTHTGYNSIKYIKLWGHTWNRQPCAIWARRIQSKFSEQLHTYVPNVPEGDAIIVGFTIWEGWLENFLFKILSFLFKQLRI